jgi:predicted transcriptional regulator
MSNKIELSEDVRLLAAYSKALSHPTRVYILKKLSDMNACCYSGDLVDEVPVGRSALSQHLKELKYSGLIQGETDPPYIKYCLHRENWEKAKQLYTDLFKIDRK